MIGLHLHTFVHHARKRSKNGDEEVVHDVIQITEDLSTERTVPPCSTLCQGFAKRYGGGGGVGEGEGGNQRRG